MPYGKKILRALGPLHISMFFSQQAICLWRGEVSPPTRTFLSRGLFGKQVKKTKQQESRWGRKTNEAKFVFLDNYVKKKWVLKKGENCVVGFTQLKEQGLEAAQAEA